MSLTVEEKPGGTRVPAPQGTHIAHCFGMIDLGTQSDQYKGKPIRAKKIWLWFELANEKTPDGKPVTVGTFATASLGEKANLRKMLESWRGKQFTPDELKGFDLKKVVGVPCMLTIIHSVKEGGGIRDKIGSITAVPAQFKAGIGTMVNPKTILELETFDRALFDKLPPFLQDKIYASPEGFKHVGPPHNAGSGGGGQHGAAGPTAAAKVDDDIPF